MGHTTAVILTLLGHFLFHELTVFVHAEHNIDPIIRQRGHLRNTKNKDSMVMRDHDEGSKLYERNLQGDDYYSDCPAQVELQIQFDEYAYEVSWELYTEVVSVDGNSIAGYGWVGRYDNSSNSGNITHAFCISSGFYNFTMSDLADDGLCCGFGQGYYKLFVDDVLVKEGGEYGSQELTSFEVIKAPTVSPAPTATPTAAPTVTCNSDEATLAVEITMDYSSFGISYNITNSAETLVLSSEPFPPEKSTVYREYCLPLGVYTFTIYSEYGNRGNYNVLVDGIEIIQGTVIYGFASSPFATPNTPTQAPTSSPTIQCNSDESSFELTLMLDICPAEVFWNLTNSVKDVVLEGGNYSYDQAMKLVNVNVCLPPSMYAFTLYDRFGDGIRCVGGGVDGYYTILVDGRQVKYGRGDYGREEVTTFSTPLSPTTSPKPSPSPTVSPQPTPLWTAFPTPSSWTSWPTPLWTSFPTWTAPTPAPTAECTSDEATFELDIKFDYTPNATSWDLTDSVGNVLLSGQDYPDYSWEPGAVHKEACLSAGSYVFTIFDDDGNGLCCMNGQGIYKLTMDGIVVKKGGVFGSQESTDIVSAPTTRTSSTSSGARTETAIASFGVVLLLSVRFR